MCIMFLIVNYHALMKCNFLACFCVICAYGIIRITSDVLNPFLPFYPTLEVSVVKGLLKTLKEELDSNSLYWVGHPGIEGNATF